VCPPATVVLDNIHIQQNMCINVPQFPINRSFIYACSILISVTVDREDGCMRATLVNASANRSRTGVKHNPNPIYP